MDFSWLIDVFVPQSFETKALVAFSVITVYRMILLFAVGYKLLYWARDHKDNKLIYYPMMVVLYPMFYFGLLYDIFIQFTVATVIFLKLPRLELVDFVNNLKNKEWQAAINNIEWTVTERMSTYLKNNDGWRAKQAEFWCRILETFDPNHCGLKHSPYAALYNK